MKETMVWTKSDNSCFSFAEYSCTLTYSAQAHVQDTHTPHTYIRTAVLTCIRPASNIRSTAPVPQHTVHVALPTPALTYLLYHPVQTLLSLNLPLLSLLQSFSSLLPQQYSTSQSFLLLVVLHPIYALSVDSSYCTVKSPSTDLPSQPPFSTYVLPSQCNLPLEESTT